MVNESLRNSEKVYMVIRAITVPIIMRKFKPIILHKEVIPKSYPIIFAPNHRQTLDPFFVFSAVNMPIHWVALKRFFTGEDSIFNNSKNWFLCQITKIMFVKMGCIPVDRDIADFNAYRMIDRYLKEGSNVGIFPEGTTNKEPEKTRILEVRSGMASFARRHCCWVQPIAILWKEIGKHRQIIVNFREAFWTEGMSVDEITQRWRDEVEKGLAESEEI